MFALCGSVIAVLDRFRPSCREIVIGGGMISVGARRFSMAAFGRIMLSSMSNQRMFVSLGSLGWPLAVRRLGLLIGTA